MEAEMNWRRGSILGASILLLAVAGTASAAAPGGSVSGSFTYHPFDRPAVRFGSIGASLAGGVHGTWSWQDWHGPVTCLVIDGNDAWIAGPGSTGPDTGVWIHLHDGGQAGKGDDMATAWGLDPGQPLEELIGWCETKADTVPLFPMIGGNVVVRD
jgi:hypothetical protein